MVYEQGKLKIAFGEKCGKLNAERKANDGIKKTTYSESVR